MTTRTALTPNAKVALTAAEKDINEGLYFVRTMGYLDVIAELMDHGLVRNLGNEQPPSHRYALTDGGMLVRGKLEHRNRIGYLAREIRERLVDGEELADIAASIDAGEEDYVGNVHVHTAMALVASLAPSRDGNGCSAADVRQEVENYLGW
jgi:hypothetical protein